MIRLKLGGGVVAFETEGEADRVGSIEPDALAERRWPKEVVDNYRRYRSRQSDFSADQSATASVDDVPTGRLNASATR